MKNCPKCRVESRDDADWCWHCGYSYEDATGGAPGSRDPESSPSSESGTGVIDAPAAK